MKARGLILTGAAFVLLAGGSATSQTMPPSDGAAMHRVQQPYDVETFGMFRNMLLTGDFTAKARLDAVMAKHPTTGVGAVADARGEITILDGKLIVSYGKQGTGAEPATDAASLLAIASAANWQSVTLDHDIAPADMEAYLARAAKTGGLDPEKSFPFEVQGTLMSYIMHVNAEPTNGPHGMGLPMAITVERKGDQIDGRVAGLYVSADLMGIATHGGERTHAHWVSPDGSAIAHLDRWGLKAGSVLMVPKP